MGLGILAGWISTKIFLLTELRSATVSARPVAADEEGRAQKQFQADRMSRCAAAGPALRDTAALPPHRGCVIQPSVGAQRLCWARHAEAQQRRVDGPNENNSEGVVTMWCRG